MHPAWRPIGTEETDKTHRFVQNPIFALFGPCLSEMLSHAVLDSRVYEAEPGQKVLDKFLAPRLCGSVGEREITWPQCQQLLEDLFRLVQVFAGFGSEGSRSFLTHDTFVDGKSRGSRHVDHDAMFIEEYGGLNIFQQVIERPQGLCIGLEIIELD